MVALVLAVIMALATGVAAWSAIDLARGETDKAFRRALRLFVLLTVLNGSFVYCALHEAGTAGLSSLITGGSYSLLFWITFPGAMISFVVFLLAWRKRRQGRT